jgi:hypothetical protein
MGGYLARNQVLLREKLFLPQSKKLVSPVSLSNCENGRTVEYHRSVELHNLHEKTFVRVPCVAIPSVTPIRFVDRGQSNYT